jgi:protein-disulfide isomerase
VTKSVGIFLASTMVFLMAGCNKPTNEQIIEAIKKDPKLLADAMKSNPQAFREAFQAAQEQMQKERFAQEEAEKEKYFKEPLKPKLGAEQVWKGSDKATVTIVEYTDFECPFCSRGADSMKEVLKKYDGKVKLTVKHLPLPFHPKAMPAAQYFEAVRIQNPKAAAQYHDVIFSKQEELKKDGEKFLIAEAVKLGVNKAKLEKDAKSDAVKKKIEADMSEAREFGFKGTPSFVVGGVPVRGALPPEEFGKVIDRVSQK